MNTQNTNSDPSGEQDPRVYLAVERTLLAWIRTGLSMMGFGFVVARFGLFLRTMALHRGARRLESGDLSRWFGTALVLVGVTVLIIAAWRHVATVQRLRRGKAFPTPAISIGVLLAALLALLGMAMSAYLLIVG